MAKSKKKTRAKPRNRAKTNGAAKPKADSKLVEFVEGMATSVAEGSIIGMVCIPINQHGTCGEVIFRGVTPPSAIALPTIALQQAILTMSAEAAERHAAMEAALAQAKAEGRLKS